MVMMNKVTTWYLFIDDSYFVTTNLQANNTVVSLYSSQKYCLVEYMQGYIELMLPVGFALTFLST